MIEIDTLTKACGLAGWRYHTFPSPRFDTVPEPPPSAQPEQASAETLPESLAALPSEPALPKARLEPSLKPRLEPALTTLRPAPVAPAPAAPAVPSVLQEVAAALSPAPAAPRPGRSGRTVRSAWRSATSSQQPR
jgi:hypothetical protein